MQVTAGTRGSLGRRVASGAEPACLAAPEEELQQPEEGEAGPEVDDQAEVESAGTVLGGRRETGRQKQEVESVAGEHGDQRLGEIPQHP